MVIFLFACKEDEPPKSTIVFDQEQHDRFGRLFVTESNGGPSSLHPTLLNGGTGVAYEIKLFLDRPMAETTVIRFSTAGTATRSEASELADFEIEPSGNLLTIDKGEQTASLWITVFEDYELEYFVLNNIAYLVEGITITLEEVVSGTGIIGAEKTFTVFITEDDPLVFLSWDPLDEPGEDPGDVDMDLFLWLDGELLTSSTQDGIAFEVATFPAGLSDGQIGLSYTYYSGSSDDLEFYVEIFNPGGNFEGFFPNRRFYEEKYNANNKNKYDESGIAPFIAQTMSKVGLDYYNVTGITVNESGSRTMKQNRFLAKESYSKFPAVPMDKIAVSKLRSAIMSN
ncbi:MAG: hypothetical protein KF803_07140 [Cyclobacteriaceae bacterium]|nr:hypothetical protein [Cyclobacteriaceae bacterium]